MKKLITILTVLGLALCFTHSAYSQKKVEEVHYFYELDTYYLTIKKIKNLKPKHQERSDIQLILADCYWNIGEKDRSRELYQAIAISHEIPTSFQEKYDRVVNVSPAVDTTEAAVIVLNQVVKSETQLMIGSNSVIKNEEDSFAAVGDITLMSGSSSTISSAAKSIPAKSKSMPVEQKAAPIQVSLDKYAPQKEPVQKNIISKKTEYKPKGKYRIRVGAYTDINEFDLPGLELLAAAEIQEWAGKKIVFAGFYESSEMAQSFIDEYLKENYKNAVVVVKKDGRYRSVK